MAGENLGASFSIDITELKAGLAQANRLIRESESEFREAAAGMDDWTDSQEGLTKRVKTLTDQVGIQQKKVNALSAEKKRLITQMKAEGKSNEEIERAVDGVNKQIERESKQLDRLNGELKKNKKSLDDMGKSAKDSGKGLEGLKTAGGVAVKAIAAVGAAAVAAVGAFFSLAGATREYRQDMAQLAQNAGDAGVSLEGMKDKLIEVGAVTGEADAALEGMNMLMATGLDTSQIETAADALTGAATKFDGLKFEGMAEGLQETLATGVAVGPFAELIERTGGDLDAFNAGLAECTTEAERQAYAMQFLTDSGLVEANDAYKETNKTLIEAAEADAKMADSLAQLGAIAEPIMTRLKLLVTDLVGAIMPLVTDLVGAIMPLVVMIGEGLTGAMSGTAGASETLAAGLGGIIDTLLSTVTNMLPMILQTVATLIPSIVTSLLEKLPMLLQVVLDAVPMILNLLTATLPQIIAKIMSLIPVLVKQLLAATPKILQAAITLLMSIVKALPTIITELITELPTLIESLISTLISARFEIFAAAITIFMEIVKAIPQIASSLISNMPKIISAIKKGLQSGFSQVKEIGKNLIEGLWEGISDMVGWIGEKIKGFGESVLGGLKKFFGIKSPSRVMADVVGKNLALGIGEGFTDEIGGVSADINRAAAKISPTVEAKVKATSTGLASGKNNGTGGNVVNVYQNNQYSKAHSRYEIYKSKQATAAAVRLAMGGT